MCYMSQVSRKNEKTSFQNMADLPIGRCTEVPPFTYCGVDMFVPYLINEKTWSINYMFNLSFIHVETTNAWDTNSFIL